MMQGCIPDSSGVSVQEDPVGSDILPGVSLCSTHLHRPLLIPTWDEVVSAQTVRNNF